MRHSGGRARGARLERLRRSPHFSDGKFHNPVPTHKLVPGTFWEMARHQLFGTEERVPRIAIPVVFHGPADFAAPPASGLRATWIGHASTLVEIDGGRLLLPVHWGTFNLAFHAWKDPAEQVVAAAQKAGVSLVVPRPGAFVDPDQPGPVERWWR